MKTVGTVVPLIDLVKDITDIVTSLN